MAKELPYYKHEPSEWLEGEIQICSDAAIVCFTNLKDGYWLKLGCMSYAFALQKYCRKNEQIIDELISNGIIDLVGEDIAIRFLDNQLKDFNDVSKKRKEAADKRWKNKAYDASALQNECKSNAIREEKIREEKIKKDKSTDGSVKPFNFKSSLISFGANIELANDWLKVRKTKKATNTETSLKDFINQVEKSKRDVNEILKVCIVKSWAGYNHSWKIDEMQQEQPKRIIKVLK
tara:strand:+ start:5716 stop:6417 length:702 start_codon:yes stop_codon:yes gene_type:complete